MKNFEDILNTEQNNEEVTQVEQNSPKSEFEKPEVNTADALAKFKKHKKKKGQNPSARHKIVPSQATENNIEVIEPAIQVVETVEEKSSLEDVAMKKQSPQLIRIEAVPNQKEVEVIVEESSPEGQLAFSIDMGVLNLVDGQKVVDVVTPLSSIEATDSIFVEEVDIQQPVKEQKKVVIQPVVATPTVVASETSENTPVSKETTEIVVEPVVSSEVVETEGSSVATESTENVQTIVKNETVIENATEEANNIVEEVQENIVSAEQEVENVPSNEPAEEINSKTKVLSKFRKLKNIEYKTALKCFVGAVAVVIIAIAVIALSKGANIVPVDEDVNTVKIQPNNQVVVIESDDTILLKKSLNEGLPVNYYSLLNSKKEVKVPNGYIGFEDVYSNAVPNLVKTTEVNGREHSNTAVFTTWAIKSKDNTTLETNRSLIEDIIAITLEGKDIMFFSNDAMMSDTISFAVERVTGEKVEVKNLQVLHDFKK